MTIRRATHEDRDTVLSILEEGFADDPFVGWVTRHKPKARRFYLELVHDRLVAPHGNVWVDEDLQSTALWVPPGAWELTLGQQLRLLPKVARVVGLLRLGTMARASEMIEAGRPETYWYLALVATRKASRGRGLARAVMTPVLELCDREGERALLETSHEHNLGWYRKLGFEITREVALGGDAPPVWAMERLP